MGVLLLFTNADERFRGFAKVVIWVGVVTSFVMGIVMIATIIGQYGLGVGVALGMVYLMLGLMITWVISLAVRTVGKVLKKVGEAREKTSLPG